MFMSPEQFAAATRTLFELQMNTFNALASKAVRGVEQAVHLNMETARQSMDETLETGRQISLARSPQAAVMSAGAGLQPGISATLAYGKDVKALIDDVHREFLAATSEQMTHARTALSGLIHDATRQAQPATDQSVLMMKNAIDHAFRGYEELARQTRQAIRQVEEHVARATEQVTRNSREPKQHPH